MSRLSAYASTCMDLLHILFTKPMINLKHNGIMSYLQIKENLTFLNLMVVPLNGEEKMSNLVLRTQHGVGGSL